MRLGIMKRSLCLLLVMAFVLTLSPVAAFAAEPPLEPPVAETTDAPVETSDYGVNFNTLGTNWPGYNPDSDDPDKTEHYLTIPASSDPTYAAAREYNQKLTYSKDMPVFDGVPEHLDAFLDTYLDWVGLEGAALYASGLRDSYRMKIDESSPAYGKLVPGGLAAADNANGINTNATPTDFPTFNAQGQTWNAELMRKVGDVIGAEKMITLFTQLTRNRNSHNVGGRNGDWSGLTGTNSTTIAFGVLTDMHVNPLAGRADEGYGEDVYHMGVMANAQAEGFVGYNDGKSSRDNSTDNETFYTRGIMSTKHPSIYTTEWFRQTANNSVGARGMYEWQIAGPLRGYESGAIMGGMTAFGRTNGIPNEISSYNILYNQISKYGYYSSPDFNGENHMFAVQGNSSSMGNGYDIRYVQDRAHALALMSLANTESVRASGTDQTDVKALYDLVKSGAYGITEDDLRNSAKGLLANMVRAGLFDEVDDEGYPEHYPYVDESRDGATDEYKADNAHGDVEEHKNVAMQSALESIVVLKSDGSLVDTDKKVAVSGFYADTRYAPQTAYANTVSNELIDYSGETPLLSMARLYDEDGKLDTASATDLINYAEGAQIVTIRDNQGRYLEVPDSDVGGALSFVAGRKTGDAAKLQEFELFDLGQDAIHLRSVRNGRWVTSPNVNATASANTTEQGATNFTLSSDLDALTMSRTSNGKQTSVGPPRLGRLSNEDATYSLYANYTDTYISTGLRMMESTTAGAFQTISATFQTDMDTSIANRKFTIDEVKGAGHEAVEIVDEVDAALVFVGAHARNSAGEGRDRTSMAMGSTDYQRVKNVAAAYAAKDKPVIVVVRTSYPVLMQDPNSTYNIQDDPNVNVIMYQSFGGRYEGRAMAQAIYGQAVPSGRMSSTWYKSDEVLPKYDYKYSVPVGVSDAYVNGGEAYVGYRFQKYDLTNADPQETGLTYMYADPDDVQYEFGYGVHISSNTDIRSNTLTMSAPGTAAADTPFNVTVGSQGNYAWDGIEVFQLYATKVNSAYGDAAPKNKLVAFAKAGITKDSPASVTLKVDPQDLAIWDVNRGDYIVEQGEYKLQLGYSAYDIVAEATINVTGGGAAPVATLDPSSYFNVYDHAFAANNVVYHEVSKLRTAQSLKNQSIVGEYSAVMSKGDDSWVAIPNVDLTGVLEARAEVATDQEAGVIELWADAPNAEGNGIKIAEFNVPVTEAVDVDADGITNTQNNQQNASVDGGVDAESRELGYTRVPATVTSAQTGTHTLYVVFKAADLRIDKLRLAASIPAEHTVTFVSNGGSTVAPITDAEEGATITRPADPTRGGYVFLGWYADAKLTAESKWNFTMDRVAGDMTLYAKWGVKNGDVTFNTLGTDWPGYNPDSDDPEKTEEHLTIPANSDPTYAAAREYNQKLTYSKDMPVFDGVPEHLDAYLDAYLDWVGLEGACLYVAGLRDSYRMKLDTSSAAYGKLVPGGLAAADNANGINTNATPTDFPTFNAQGQTWNAELMREVGEAIGTEKMITLFTQLTRDRNRHNNTDWSGLAADQSRRGSTTIAFGVLTDMHVNPLAGRGDEGYGEDVYHMGVMANAQAEGFVGFNDGKSSRDGSTDDETFYTRGIISTKHPSIYTTEWFRQTANNSVGARGMYEWQIAGPFKGYESGAIMGGMTSFGRTNGIPNEISSYNILYNQISKYGYYSSPDFNAENHMYAVQSAGTSSMGNGYDVRYVQDRAHALALMALANTEAVRAMGTDQTDVKALYDLVKSGAYGITEADLRNAAKALLANMVRAGLFDEVDDEGYPEHYPYVDESRDGATDEYKAGNAHGDTAKHKDVALRSAQESIVVLKSDGKEYLLDTSKKVAVSGFYADTRYTPQTAYANTVSNSRIEYSGETPLLSMARLYDEDGGKTATDYIHYNDGARVVTIQDDQGRYLEVPDSDAGGTLSFASATRKSGAAASLQEFELFDMGQDAIMLRSVRNGNWVTSPNANATSPANTTAPGTNNFTLSDLETMTMSNSNKITGHPPRFGWIRHSDTSYSLYGNYTDTYLSTGLRMMESTSEGAFQTVSATFQTDMDTEPANRNFTINQVASPGAAAIADVSWADAAVVFVGAHARNSAGEGRDRSSMAMGSTDYQRVKDVAAAYAAAGKPVIVVVRTSYPVLMQDPNSTYNIQGDPNVNIIMYQSFGGRYEGRAMAQSLYGKVIPSGRMSTTWYKSDDVLPTYDYDYSVPVGASGNYSDPNYVNYRFQKYDMTNADPQETGLTYMYADPADVQYEFGYGVQINGGDFGIVDDQVVMGAPGTAAADTPFNVTVSGTNMGNSPGVEVLQLYARKINSAYGSAAPLKKLVAFEKVEIADGATFNVTLEVDPQDLAIWDVNRGDYIVEEGQYELQLGYSSEDIIRTATINVSGGGAAPVATLDPSSYFNVFDHAFASNDVVYQEVSKLRTAESLKDQAIVGEYSAVMSKGDGAWVAIPNVNLTGVGQVRAEVATNKEPGVIELWADAPNAEGNGTKIAEFTVPVTEAVDVDADGITNTQNNQQNANVDGGVDAESRELGYTRVAAAVSGAPTGTHTLYVVFKAADLRIDRLMLADSVAANHTVTFESNGGSAVAPVTGVEDGSVIREPEPPKREGYIFAGWYADAALTTKWKFTTSRVNGNITLYAKWSIPVASVTLDRDSLTLNIGETDTLTATVLPDDADNKTVTWESSDPTVATVSTAGLVTAVAPGTAIITATSADGTSISDSCAVRVLEADSPDDVPVITLDQQELNLPIAGAQTLNVTIDPVNAGWTAQLLDAAEKEASTIASVITLGNTITVTGTSTGTAWLRVVSTKHPEVMARIRVNVYDTNAKLQPAQFNLDTTTVTVPVYMEAPTAVKLWQDRVVTGQSYRGWGPTTKTLTFVPASEKTEADAAILNEYFIIESGTDGELNVRFDNTKDPAGLKKASYSAKVAIYEGTEWLQEVKGTLTIKKSTTLPRLKAPTLSINTWFNDWSSADIRDTITGATVNGLSPDTAKKTPVPSFLNTDNLSVNGTVTTTLAKKSGTLYLLADLEGWWKAAPVSVKVSAASATPKLKFSSTSVSLFSDPAKSEGRALKLVSNNKNVPYEDIGVTGLTLAGTQYEDLGFDAATGEFTLKAATTPTNGTLTFQAAIFGSDKPVDVKLKVSVVSASKAIKLNPSKKTVTLSANPAAQDAVAIMVNPSASDLFVDTNAYTYTVDGAATSDKLDVDINGREVTISAKAGITAGTYKVAVSWADMNASTTITVKATANAPSIKLKAKGSVNLTTGAASTITATVSNYAGAYTPEWNITGPAGTGNLADRFDIADLGGGKYSFAPDGDLVSGTYKLSLGGKTTGNTDIPASKTINLKVTATKPKVTMSTKAITLYRSDKYSEGNIVLTLPAGVAAIRDVQIKESKTSGNFDIKYLGSGQVAIGFKGQEYPNIKANSTSLTLNIFLVGNTGEKAVATASVKVTLK